MPKRKPDIDEQPELIETTPATAKRRPKLSIPITESGELDMSRIKDPEVLNKARAALGSDPVFAEPTEKPKLPDEVIPILYDGLAMGIAYLVKLAKWPSVMTEEQRQIFTSNFHYSAEFKEKATEPTNNLLTAAIGNSKLAQWLMANKDAAILIPLLGLATKEMFENAAQQFNKDWAALQQQRARPASNFPSSENRPVPPDPSIIATGATA